MKIVHVLPSLARGGGERLAIELANRQVDAGHEVSFVIGSSLPAEQCHGGLDPRVRVREVSAASGRRRYGAMLPWIWREREWLESHDVLHSHLTYAALFATALKRVLRKARPAIVETYHAVGMPIPKALRSLHARMASQWDGLSLMVDDPYWRRFNERHPGVHFDVIPVGVDAPPLSDVLPEDREQYRSALGIPARSLVVTSIGRLVAERRPRAYLPVFGELTRLLDRDVHFLLGGDGPEREAMEAEAKALGIGGRLHFAGLVREIERPLAITDLYITANVGPVSGVAGLQAIAAGVPTIAIQLRDDYSPPATDWIWSSRDPKEIAGRAAGLLSDAAAAKALATTQQQHLEAHHSAAAMATAYERFYQAAIAGKDASGGK
jgi:glycosyltransferase involved in cell wall biosynthesis